MDNLKTVGADDPVCPKPKRNTQSGITLIALIITIIILLILAMVTIRILMNQGIIKHARNATDAYNEAQNNEAALLAYQEGIMDQLAGGNSSSQGDATEIAKIQAGYNKYKTDIESGTTLNQADLDKLIEYCIGNNDKDLLQDVLEDPNNMIFKNREPMPNARTELTYVDMEQATVDENMEIYIYFTYNEKKYKLTSWYVEEENNGEFTDSYPTKTVEFIPDESSSAEFAVEGANVREDDINNGWEVVFPDTKHRYKISEDGTIKKVNFSIIERYFLGEDGEGQDISIVANMEALYRILSVQL